jgi:hypothetical protein
MSVGVGLGSREETSKKSFSSICSRFLVKGGSQQIVRHLHKQAEVAGGVLAEGLQKRRVNELGSTGHLEQIVQTLEQLGRGQGFGSQSRPDAAGDGQEVGLFEAVSQVKVKRRSPARTVVRMERESSSTLDKSRSRLTPRRSFPGLHQSGGPDDTRVFDVKEPIFPAELGASPLVVRRQGNREKVPNLTNLLAIKVGHRSLGGRLNST